MTKARTPLAEPLQLSNSTIGIRDESNAIDRETRAGLRNAHIFIENQYPDAQINMSAANRKAMPLCSRLLKFDFRDRHACASTCSHNQSVARAWTYLCKHSINISPLENAYVHLLVAYRERTSIKFVIDFRWSNVQISPILQLTLKPNFPQRRFCWICFARVGLDIYVCKTLLHKWHTNLRRIA